MSTSTFKPHPLFARLWIKMAPKGEEKGVADHRQDMLAGLSGRVLELGAGNGLNFPHYPEAVTEVVAVEPEPTLRAAAEEGAPERVRVGDTVADRLPGEGGGFGTAVVSLVLCSVADQATALAELRRVIRPGGELRFYEHVIPQRQPKRALVQALDASGLCPKPAAGCHPARDTGAAIVAAGFAIEQCERFGFRGSALEPAIPYILGCARFV